MIILMVRSLATELWSGDDLFNGYILQNYKHDNHLCQ